MKMPSGGAGIDARHRQDTLGFMPKKSSLTQPSRPKPSDDLDTMASKNASILSNCREHGIRVTLRTKSVDLAGLQKLRPAKRPR